MKKCSARSRITLTVKNGSDLARTNEPASYGIPFSITDRITSLSDLGIIDNNSVPVDAQFMILSRYNGQVSDTSKPIRMILCTFFANVPANSSSSYRLVTGGSGNTQGNDIITETKDVVAINTGVLSIELNKNEGFSLFDRVVVDGSVLVNSPADDGIIVSANNDYYKSNESVPEKVEIEQNGPLKAVAAVHGLLKNSSGSEFKPQGSLNGMAYTTRVTAYKNKSYVHVQTTIKNENQGYVGHDVAGTDHQNLHFDNIHLKTTLNGLTVQKQVRFEGFNDTNASGVYAVRQNHVENGQIEENNFIYKITKNDIQQLSGIRYNSYSSIGDSGKGLMIATRWFWQNWPKAIELDADNSVVRLCLWPEKTHDYLFPGAFWKTHEAIYYFHKNLNNTYKFERELASLH